MSYEVLARKYRSAGFDDVVGQEHIAQTLKRAIETSRVAHAYLFCGTRGTGKTSMARILAKALNCEKSDGPTKEPCGKCGSCVSITAGNSMSVQEIDAASNTGVDNVREIIEDSRNSAPGRFRIYIIDEAHMLSKGAFNALLKTLEEPPAHVKFILATTEAEKVPATILSRCQRYDFRNIPTREIAGHLKEICKQEKIKAEEDALALVAKAGAGSMRDALSLLDRMLSLGEKTLTVELIEQMLGLPKSQVIFDLAEAIGRGDTKATLEQSARQIDAGMSPDTLIGGLTDHLRNLLVLRTCGAKSDLVEVPGLSIEDLAAQAERFDPAALSQDIAILEELRRNMRTSQAGRALLDATLVRLALAEQFATVGDLLTRVDGTAPALAPRPAASTRSAALPSPAAAALKKNDEVGPPIAAEPANVESVAMNDLPAVWQTMLNVLSSKGAGFLPLVEDASLVSIDDDVAVLQYPHDRDTIVRMLDRNGKRDVIRDALSGILHKSIGLKIELAPAPVPAAEESDAPVANKVRPAPLPPAPRVPEPETVRITKELRAELRANPLVNAVIEHLGGEIVKVESDV